MTKYNDINLTEVEDFLNSWKNGVIDIGIAHQEGNDYRQNAKAFIKRHYAFDAGKVLFKPTFTNNVAFRNNLEGALSYFVSGDISEDYLISVEGERNDERISSVLQSKSILDLDVING